MPDLFQKILEKITIQPLLDSLTENKETVLSAPLGVIPFIIKLLAKERNVIYVAGDELEAESVIETLRSFCENDEALFFPEIDVIPFTHVFPSPDKLADRVNTLYLLNRSEKGRMVVTTAEAFFRKLPPVDYFHQSEITLRTGDILNPEEFSRQLVDMAYVREYKVSSQGSFSIRGDIVDVFPPHSRHAYRINLFDNEIESIREFHPLTQKSEQESESCSIIPASEFALKREFTNEERNGEETAHSLFPEFYSRLSRLTDYSLGDKVIILGEKALKGYQDTADKYAMYMVENGTADYLLFSPEYLREELTVSIAHLGPDVLRLNVKPPTQFEGGFSAFVEETSVLLGQENRAKMYVFVEHEALARRLAVILKKFQPEIITPGTLPDDGKNLYLVRSVLEKGFVLESPEGIEVFLGESDISGKKRMFHKRLRQIDTLFEDLEDIREGEYVVHLNYGIGVFRGVQRIDVLGKAKDYILIEYDDGERLFVPLEQANLIGKYVGAENKRPKLDSLGGKSWQNKKDRVQKSVQEFAEKLVRIYARRGALRGHAYALDTVWQKEFEDQFEYIETTDQVTVVEEIKKDMENERPMDRLLCGDVGFGKTEVAMRAAFKAVMDGKQVALIAPTTVLTEQHYLTFSQRFRGFPVKIDYISRFSSGKKLSQVIRNLQQRKVDILIGTHKLFSEKIQFHSLGLVIIDEEHKFGVEQKETLKERYPLVDFLSLSATPIPRTLNMALSSIRDISLLRTPPDMRIPVQTYVSDFSMEVVKYAIEKELNRGGQVFFVHNTIKRLPEYAFAIEKMVPNARVSIGHGQMEEEELEEAFMGFVKGHYNVFVSTTIIDSGLDIPNSNTIIISDAHRYGLAQLYQLKGRVGRATREGHAYFLYPKEKVLTETAQKRLFVINEYTDLGSGFNIAMKDLEIRGAGNILGREQHGNIIAVGYDMYMRLLKEEVQKLKGEYNEKVETLIDLNYDAFIPDGFISDPASKMEVYKRIVSVSNEDEIRELTAELSDRFGKIPDEVSTLFEIARLKLKAEIMGIQSLIEKGHHIEIMFGHRSQVDPIKVLNVKTTGKHPIEIRPHMKNTIYYKRFDSTAVMKVRRLVGFLEDIREIK